jgi:hypothetical protein
VTENDAPGLMFPEFQTCAEPESDVHVCVVAPPFVTVTVVPTGTVNVAGENVKSFTVSAADPLAPAAVIPTSDVAPQDAATSANAHTHLIQIRPMYLAYGRGSGGVQPTGAQSDPPPGAGRCRTARSGVIVTVEPSTEARPSTISE